jgi:hypothetical protein
MAVRFQLRRDTAANWTSVNPILALGEPGVETDTLKVKVGDGVTAWNSLAYSITKDFTDLTSKPTTIAGYGITDAVASSSVSVFGASLIDDADATTARTTLGLGTAATTAATAYATAAQGSTADTAVQPGDNIQTSIIDSSDSSAITITPDVVMQAGLTVGNHIVPSSNENIDLGSVTNRFRDLYLSGNTLNLGGTTISKHTDGSLAVKAHDTGAPMPIRAKELVVGEGANTIVIRRTVDGLVEFDSQDADGVSGGLIEGKFFNLRTTGNVQIDGDLVVSGDTTTLTATNLAVSDNMLYLNNAIETTITDAVGDGDDVVYTTSVEHGYTQGMTVSISGVDSSAYNLSEQTITAVTTDTFTIENAATGAYVSGGTARARTNANPDLGFAAGYYDGGYGHAGFFRDATDGVFKVFEGYTPEPDASAFIDIADPSFSIADFQAGTGYFTDISLGGTAVTATAAELNYTDGVTSNIQTQLDAKANLSGANFTGNVDVTGTVKAGNIIADSSNTISVFGWQQAALSTGDGYKTVRSENGLDGYNYYASLYWQDDLKLRTTDSGIDVTGEITASGDISITGGDVDITGAQPRVNLKETDTTDLDVTLRLNAGDLIIETRSDAGTALGDRIRAASNGDISFYEDTGTTAKFFWDASAERLGIGTSSPAYELDVRGTGDTYIHLKANSSSAGADDDAILILDAAETGESVIQFRLDGVTKADIEYFDGDPALNISTAPGSGAHIDFQPEDAVAMRITSAGRVGIGGEIDPDYTLDVNGTTNATTYRKAGVAGKLLVKSQYTATATNYTTTGFTNVVLSNNTNYVPASADSEVWVTITAYLQLTQSGGDNDAVGTVYAYNFQSNGTTQISEIGLSDAVADAEIGYINSEPDSSVRHCVTIQGQCVRASDGDVYVRLWGSLEADSTSNYSASLIMQTANFVFMEYL